MLHSVHADRDAVDERKRDDRRLSASPLETSLSAYLQLVHLEVPDTLVKCLIVSTTCLRTPKSLLLRHLTNLQGPIYYVAGPPAMVTGMRKMLVGAGFEEDDIRTEEFGGY
jgi:ferredoxin-NADP reductase